MISVRSFLFCFLPTEQEPDGVVVALGKARRGGRALNAGVHVRLIVVAEIYHVVTALHRAGERLEADVVGAAVAADGEELVGIVDPALALEYIVSRLDAAAGRRCILEGRMDVGSPPMR